MGRVQLQGTLVIGNSGAGKSGLAAHIASVLGVPAVDLDEIHWQGEAYGARLDESEARRLVADAAARPTWVMEGVYGGLARVALPSATALIWLDLPWEECRAGLMARGLRRGMTDADHADLVTWAAEYCTRDNANSQRGHLRLFDAFAGPKLRLTSRSEVDQLVAGI